MKQHTLYEQKFVDTGPSYKYIFAKHQIHSTL